MNSNIKTIIKRELYSYFSSPVAYIFIIIFLVLSGYFPLLWDEFFKGDEASLFLFFKWHPILYLFLVPAIGMQSWSDERNMGTIELLFTMPISLKDCIIGKFVAAWAFLTLTILLTFPMALTVIYLGEPDLGSIFCGYVGSILLAGSLLAISTFISAISKSPIISFILSAVICLILILAGVPSVTTIFISFDWAFLIDIISSFSLLTHFSNIQRGVIDLRDITYYVSIILFSLSSTWIVLKNHRSL